MVDLRALVYGGKGALGSVCIEKLKSAGYWVCSVDFGENVSADANITVPPSSSLEEQNNAILASLSSVVKDDKFNGIFCVAGGWAGGNASSNDFIKNCDLTWKQSVWTSCIAANIAAKHLDNHGILVLTGAVPALSATPDMIGYGLAKAAVHQLTKSLAESGSGLPTGSSTVAILPVTLDTPMNRKFMPKSDFSKWTPLQDLASVFVKWTAGVERPTTGSLLKVITEDNVTKFLPAD